MRTTTPFGHSEWAAAGAAPLRDDGFSLVELVFVIAILGILTAVVSLTLTGARTEAAESGCLTDQRNLRTAYASYVAQTEQQAIAPSGADHDRFERTLVLGGYLESLSTMHDLGVNGAVTAEASSC